MCLEPSLAHTLETSDSKGVRSAKKGRSVELSARLSFVVYVRERERVRVFFFSSLTCDAGSAERRNGDTGPGGQQLALGWGFGKC